jgi:hypothetical protein
MILPELKLSSRINKFWNFSGIDDINSCKDKKHFLSYPYTITYEYNSRGFRDHEWPESLKELKNAVWCIGDSFTVGLGSPKEHTWPFCLSKITGRRVINVSMDGASNEWISRIAKSIIRAIDPINIVIMWSYTHRREHSNALLNDEDRRMFYGPVDKLRSKSDDWQNFLNSKSQVDLLSKNSIQFSIPGFHHDHVHWSKIRGNKWPKTAPNTLEELNTLPAWIRTELKELHQCLDSLCVDLSFNHDLQHQHSVVPVCQQDFARDGLHFDLITAEWVAEHALVQLLDSKRLPPIESFQA